MTNGSQNWTEGPGLTSEMLREMYARVHGKGFAEGGYYDGTYWKSNKTMHEVNPRKPKPKPAPCGVRIDQRTSPNPGRRVNIVHVMVPNCLGRHEPLLDGNTGKPVDFAAELGDPRSWSVDRTEEINAILNTAANRCLSMVKLRAPQ
jgi:hypothetical protein